MPNPYAHGQPADPVREFAGREEELRRVRACVESTRTGNVTNVFVDGEWGIGKTSLLNKLRPELQERGPVISEDLADDPDQARWFYKAIFSELLEIAPRAATEEDFRDLEIGDSRRIRKLLKVLWTGLHDGGPKYEIVVIMLDNLERARPDFLPGVRDVFQRLTQEGARYMLVFAGKHLPTQGAEASDPVGRFFNPRIVLLPLDEEASIEAIRKPVRFLPPFSFTDDAARLIHDRAAGHPYFLKLICHELYDLTDGKVEVNVSKLEELWLELEDRLEVARFGDQFSKLPEGEQLTLLHASMLGPEFEARDLRPTIKKSLDTYLSRLLDKRELLRSPSRGVYRLYHPLFRTYLQGMARERKLKPTLIVVPEGRPVLGREEVEERIAAAARRRLDIVDQHFRGRAVSMLEAVQPGVRVRILMGEDPAWSSTKRLLNDLAGDLKKRIEVRAWPDKSKNRPVPWHYRCLIGDREVWRFDHSLDGAGKKRARFTDDSSDRKQHEQDFERWWRESNQVFP